MLPFMLFHLFCLPTAILPQIMLRQNTFLPDLWSTSRKILFNFPGWLQAIQALLKLKL
jgi:hypothetical protein